MRVDDRIDLRESAEIVWPFATRADVAPDDEGALLTQGDKKLRVRVVSPAGAKLQTVEVPANEQTLLAKPLRLVEIHHRGAKGENRFEVKFALETQGAK